MPTSNKSIQPIHPLVQEFIILRTAVNLSITQLALNTGVARKTIGQWEGGQAAPSLPNFATVLAGLDRHLEIVGGADAELADRSPISVENLSTRLVALQEAAAAVDAWVVLARKELEGLDPTLLLSVVTVELRTLERLLGAGELYADSIADQIAESLTELEENPR